MRPAQKRTPRHPKRTLCPPGKLAAPAAEVSSAAHLAAYFVDAEKILHRLLAQYKSAIDVSKSPPKGDTIRIPFELMLRQGQPKINFDKLDLESQALRDSAVKAVAVWLQQTITNAGGALPGNVEVQVISITSKSIKATAQIPLYLVPLRAGSSDRSTLLSALLGLKTEWTKTILALSSTGFGWLINLLLARKPLPAPVPGVPVTPPTPDSLEQWFAWLLCASAMSCAVAVMASLFAMTLSSKYIKFIMQHSADYNNPHERSLTWLGIAQRLGISVAVVILLVACVLHIARTT